MGMNRGLLAQLQNAVDLDGQRQIAVGLRSVSSTSSHLQHLCGKAGNGQTEEEGAKPKTGWLFLPYSTSRKKATELIRFS
jgi:hypothetical protein